MTDQNHLEIFLVAVPGFEETLRAEAIEKGFKKPTNTKGGVSVKGNWETVWRANLELRGASKVLVRLGSFRVTHLSQLDKRAKTFPWDEYLRSDIPVRVDVTCKKSKIYHQKAAAERIERALSDVYNIEISQESDVCLKVRILNDVCTISIDTSGEGLHKRGHKAAINKAPMRETLASLLLRECGYKGKEPVVDPMCGSGTFIIEAAEIAARLNAGRSREFAFEKLATFDPEIWQDMQRTSRDIQPDVHFYGYDRDKGGINMSQKNAKSASVENFCTFTPQSISELRAPDGETGLVMINPPYGTRIGDVDKLLPLYQSLGKVLKENFKGWRVGIVTNQAKLAKSMGLRFEKSPMSFSHGGIRVTLYKSNGI